MVNAFINGVNLLSEEKRIATTALNNCVKAKPSIPADFDVKPEEFQGYNSSFNFLLIE
jgi:hypothetical protein